VFVVNASLAKLIDTFSERDRHSVFTSSKNYKFVKIAKRKTKEAALPLQGGLLFNAILNFPIHLRHIRCFYLPPRIIHNVAKGAGVGVVLAFVGFGRAEFANSVHHDPLAFTVSGVWREYAKILYSLDSETITSLEPVGAFVPCISGHSENFNKIARFEITHTHLTLKSHPWRCSVKM
jgi:hypothetical protein